MVDCKERKTKKKEIATETEVQKKIMCNMGTKVIEHMDAYLYLFEKTEEQK